jgi:hypothetical protein
MFYITPEKIAKKKRLRTNEIQDYRCDMGHMTAGNVLGLSTYSSTATDILCSPG